MSSSCTTQTRVLPSRLEFSAEGLALLQKLEGYRLRAYPDSGGKLTIGYGHLMLPGEPHKITKEEAARLLRVDVGRTVKAVRDLVKVPLWQSEFDALVIFVFNIGATAFRKSTMLRKLKALDYREASYEFGRWVFVNGVKNKGLINRRNAERQLFNTVPF
jgi:lysozyme